MPNQENSAGELWVQLGLDDKQYNSGLQRAQQAAQQAGSKIEGHFNKIKGVLAGIGIAIGGAAIIGGITTLVRNVINTGDEMYKMSQKTGVAVETLYELQYAGRLSDVTMQQVQTGLMRLSRTMYDAAAGNKEAQQTFKDLGVAYQDSTGRLRDSGVVLYDIADRLSKIEDGATKTATAMKLFGRSGADLIPLINNLQELAEEARAVGYALSDETAAKFEMFNDNLTRLEMASEGFARQLAVGLSDALVQVTNGLIQYSKNSQIWITVGQVMGEVIKGITMSLMIFLDGFKVAGAWIGYQINYWIQLFNLLASKINENPLFKKIFGENKEVSKISLIESAPKTLEEFLNYSNKIADSWGETWSTMNKTVEVQKKQKEAAKPIVDEEKQRLDIINQIRGKYESLVSLLKYQTSLQLIDEQKREMLDDITRNYEKQKLQNDEILKTIALRREEQKELVKSGALDPKQLSAAQEKIKLLEQEYKQQSLIGLKLQEIGILKDSLDAYNKGAAYREMNYQSAVLENQNKYNAGLIDEQTYLKNNEILLESLYMWHSANINLLRKQGYNLDQFDTKLMDLTNRLKSLSYEQMKFSETAMSGWMRATNQMISNAITAGYVAYETFNTLSSSLEENVFNVMKLKLTNFKDFFINICNDLINTWYRMIAKMVTQAAMNQLTSFMVSAISSYDIASLGGNTAVMNMMNPQKYGGIWNQGIQKFGSGAVFHSPKIFPMASGGIGMLGEEGPEAVMPLTRLANGNLGVQSTGGNTNVIVNVIDNNNSTVSTNQKYTQNGLEIDVLIDKAVAKKLSQKGSSSSKVLQNQYGARERLINR